MVNRISDSLDEDEYHWKKPWGVKRFESMILAKFMLDHAFNGLSEDKLKDDEKIAFENLSNSAFSKMFNDEFSEVGLNYEDMQEEIQTKIGLEIHVQLTRVKTKLFCSCSSDYRNSEPNVMICPTCMGFPGTLPVVNKEAMKFAMLIGLA